MAEKKEDAKSAKKEDAKPAAAAPKKGGKKSRIVMAAVAMVLLGSGSAWWFMRGDTDGAVEEVKVNVVPALPPVYVALDPFTVNLQPEAVGSQYMQIGITLKIAGQVMADKLKDQMPEARSRLLMVLSAKRASELLVPEGKVSLAKELQMEITQILDPEAVKKPLIAPVPPVNVATAPTNTRTDVPGQATEGEPPAESSNPAEATAEAPASDTAEAAPAETSADNDNIGPVLSVLFTSFIIQ